MFQLRIGALALLPEPLALGLAVGYLGDALSIPIIVIVKVMSQHVEQLHPQAEVLGD